MEKNRGSLPIFAFGIFILLTACAVSPPAFTVGGKITGLKSPILLENAGRQSMTLYNDGEFTFLGSNLQGTTFDVIVKQQPASQTCTVSGGQGTFTDENVKSVIVTCGKVVTVGTWNIQNFGTSKAAKSSVMDLISKVMLRYDILFVQEVSTVGGGVGSCGTNSIVEICALLNRVNSADRAGAGTYSVVTSAQSGTTGAEKYAVFYRNSLVSISENFLVSAPAEGTYTRPPMVVRVNIGSQNFYVASIHTSPGVATQEIQDLPKVANARYNTDNEIMIVGDFNADGSYFTESTGWPVFNAAFSPTSSAHTNAIGDSVDTTVAQGNTYTYDRMTLSPNLAAKMLANSAAPYYFDGYAQDASVACPGGEVALMAAIIAQGYGTTCNTAAAQVSDHYPVSVQLIY